MKKKVPYKNTCFNISVNEVNIKNIGKIEYEEYFKKMENEINKLK